MKNSNRKEGLVKVVGALIILAMLTAGLMTLWAAISFGLPLD